MPAVKSTGKNFNVGIDFMRKADNLQGLLAVINGDHQHLRFFNSGGNEQLMPRGIAKMGFHTVFGKALHHHRIHINNRRFITAHIEHFINDLAKSAHANDDDRLLLVNGIGCARFHFFSFRKTVMQNNHQRRKYHREHDNRRHIGVGRFINHPFAQCAGEQDERKLAALRHNHRAVERVGMAAFGETRDGVDARRFGRHQRGHAGENQPPVTRDHGQIERHADAEEKETEQQATEGLNIRFQLVAEGGFGEENTRDKRTHRHRQPARFHQQRRAEDDEQRGGSHHFARAGGGEDAKERVEQKQADGDQRGECRQRHADGLPQRFYHLARRLQRREKGDDGQQRHNQQILKKQNGDNALPTRAGNIATLVQHLHDDRGRSQHEARRADETHLPRKAVQQANAGQQNGAHHHLQTARPKIWRRSPHKCEGFISSPMTNKNITTPNSAI